MNETKIVVIGMGYVGIPMAVLLADVDGFYVTGIQRKSKRSGWKIEYLNKGRNPFEGEDLQSFTVGTCDPNKTGASFDTIRVSYYS